MYLHELPDNHPDRNKSLGGCWYRWKNGGTWRQINASFAIAAKCYNQLAAAWTDSDVFTFDKPEGA